MALIGVGLSGVSSAAQGVLSMGAASAASGDSYHYTKKLQDQAERFNAEQAEITRAYNAEQAKINRDWQAKLAGSAYQRARADLEKANLNPLLALTNPSATPSGGSASASAASVGSGGVSASPADMSSIGRFGSDAMKLMTGLPQAAADVQNTSVDTGLKQAQIGESSARAELAHAQAIQALANADKANSQSKYRGIIGDAMQSVGSAGVKVADSVDTAIDIGKSFGRLMTPTGAVGYVGTKVGQKVGSALQSSKAYKATKESLKQIWHSMRPHTPNYSKYLNFANSPLR